MKSDEKTIEEVLQGSLPSAPRAQMDAALDRVFTRLQSDRGETVVEPLLQDDSPRAASWRVPPKRWREAGLVPPKRPRAGGWWRPAITATAAVLVAAIVFIMAWRNRDVYAVLELADSSMSRIVDGNSVPVQVQGQIGAEEIVRSNGGAVLAMADGSRVEMRSQSELSFERAEDGVRIRLRTGGIIVTAAKQGKGHLYVQTRDVTVAVVGTVFVVNAEADGSRVTVIEGEVRVHEGKIETRLRPGEQVSTSPTMATRPVKEEFAWSRHADAHLAILTAFTEGMALTAGPLTPLANTSGSVMAAVDQSSSAAAQGQPAAPSPQFEEASIRPCDPDNIPPAPAGARGGGPNSFQMTPGRTHALCMTLATIIRHAYGYGPADINPGGRGRGLGLNNVYGLGVEDGRRVRGGPDWVRAERYTIDAVADGAADAATMSGPMLRDLLERRFQLKAHIETEQIPAFALIVAESGLKMKEGTCTPADASSAPRGGGAITSTRDMVSRNLEAARRGATTAYPCGFAGSTNGPNILFVGAGAGVPALGGVLGAPVINRTGIPDTVRFNYVLEFAPDERAAGPLGRALLAANEPSDIPRAPDLFTAIKEQLGLLLEPARAPREFIVIDRVERPTPN